MAIELDPKKLPTSTFACGPSQGLPQVRQTPLYKTLFERSHRAADISYQGLYHNAVENLRTLLSLPKDYTVLFFMGGANPAMDAVLWNLTKHSLSGLSFGAFSKRWANEMAARLEKNVIQSIRETKGNEFFPREKPDYNASLVILTPNETSTGVQIPDEYLEEAWQQKGPETLIAWDCTSCAGGRDLPQNKFDVMIFSLQKCFGAGGGTSVVVLSPAAVERIEEVKKIRTVPFTLDLVPTVKYAQTKYQTSNTPSTINIWMFNEACKWMNENGGIKAMDALCRHHAQHLLDWAAGTDFAAPLIKDEKFRSYTSLTLEITDLDIQDSAISAALAATGLANLADGVKKFSSVKQNSLRIACFPFVDTTGVGEYEKLTAAIDEIVRQLRQQDSTNESLEK